MTGVRASSHGAGAAPRDLYGEQYFRSYNYADRALGRYSMYWFARRYYARLVRRFAPKPARTARLLELGCGMGHLLALLAPDFRCVGLDVAGWAAEETRRNAPGAAVVVGSAEELGVFPDRVFDVIVALHLVEHLTDPAACLRETARLLVAGGVLLFATPNPVYALRRLKRPHIVPDAIAKDPTHVNVHPPATWRTWVEAADMRVVRHFGDGLWDVPYLPLLPARLQFAVFGLPSALQVATGRCLLPTALGVNQVIVARRPG